MTADSLILIIIALASGGLVGGVLTYLVARRVQPSVIEGNKADTVATLQGTLAQVLQSQSSQLNELDEVRKELNGVRKELVRYERLNTKLTDDLAAARKVIAGFRKFVAEFKTGYQNDTDALKAEIVILKKRVSDYPQRVVELEAIIASLRAEKAELKGEAKDSADLRRLEAQNIKDAQAMTPPDKDAALEAPAAEIPVKGTVTGTVTLEVEEPHET